MPRKKILIIEDEAALLYALKARLTVDGFQVLTALTAEEALEVLEKEKPEIIVLDILLPKMDGFEFLKKVKSDKEKAKIPVIIISNLSKKEDIEKGINLGAKDFLVKTEFNLDTLIEKIKEALSHAQ